jgi:shikimate dehydrogenase
MISAARQGAAVLGSPISHSLSPVLHRAAYDALGLTGWTYRALECGEADLGTTLRSADATGLAGVSLTMPLKRAVVPMLATADDWAVSVGAANTVVFGDDGRWRGANTDVPGMIAVLRTAGVEPGAPGVPWVLGAGATASSALAALAALDFPAAVVVARRPTAAIELVALAERLGMLVSVRPWSEIEGLGHAPITVSTTPAGATDGLAAELSAVSGLLVDVVYSPWPTAVASAWERAGGRVVGGVELLVEQAIEQVHLMTGQLPPAAPMRRAGYAALADRS